ncbi:hypothetical protein DVH05_000202 [Phytophthora capsici]|nr:hypothetical protein DVH05_000202 [Phytophthora capsici]
MVTRNRSPNPRPRQQRRRMRDEDATAAASASTEAAPSQDANSAATQAAPATQQAAGSPDGVAMLQQMFQAFLTSTQQQQQFLSQVIAQQTQTQQQMLQQQVLMQRSQKKKGNPPSFNGQTTDDLELWIFSTEQYYADCQSDMDGNTSVFVDMIFANLGPTAKTWFRDFKMSLGNEPATWAIFKAKIRERFRDSDFEHKVLSKLHQLRRAGSQQEYTTRFLHLLSQLDQDVPEFVKRWYYQQHLPEDVSSFISQHVPKTLQDVIELAHRYADSRPAKTATAGFNNRKNEAKTASASGGQGNNTKPPASASSSGETKQASTNTSGRVCDYCAKPGHTRAVCRKLKADERANQQKN